MRKFLYVIITTILLSCANTVDPVGDLTLDGNYRIVKVKGEESLPEDIIFNFNPVGNRVTGNAGCNRFSALYHLQENKLEFSTPMNTRKYCEGKMEVEKQILSSLEKANSLKRAGEKVIIYSNSEDPLMTLIKIE